MAFDCIFLSIYIIEALLKIISMGLQYFYDAWNNLGGWKWGCLRETVGRRGQGLGV